VEASVGPAVLDALDGGGDLAEDTHLVSRIVKLATLKVGHLEAEVPDQIVVNEVGDGCGKVVGDEGGKGPPFTGKNVFLLSVAVLVAGGKHRARFGLVVDHSWFRF